MDAIERRRTRDTGASTDTSVEELASQEMHRRVDDLHSASAVDREGFWDEGCLGCGDGCSVGGGVLMVTFLPGRQISEAKHWAENWPLMTKGRLSRRRKPLEIATGGRGKVQGLRTGEQGRRV